MVCGIFRVWLPERILGEIRPNPYYSPKDVSFLKAVAEPVLEHKLELGSHILPFDSTNGTYLLAEYEGKRITQLRERATSFFNRKFVSVSRMMDTLSAIHT